MHSVKARLLRAFHLKPWRDANSKERVDVNNGLLLVPNLDALFDQHLIAFGIDGTILISASLSDKEGKILVLRLEMKIDVTNTKLDPYLTYHRTAFAKLEGERISVVCRGTRAHSRARG